MSKDNKVKVYTSENSGFKMKSNAPTFTSVSKIVITILGIIALTLFIVNFIHYANGTSNVSFEGFLNYLSNIPSFRITTHINDFTISSDWGLFNWFRDFLNIFGTFFGVIVFCFSSLFNMLTYVSYFLVYIFG